jgi:hypothetical protein
VYFDDEEKQDEEEKQDYGDFEFGIFSRSFFFGGCGVVVTMWAKVRQ